LYPARAEAVLRSSTDVFNCAAANLVNISGPGMQAASLRRLVVRRSLPIKTSDKLLTTITEITEPAITGLFVYWQKWFFTTVTDI